jgi:hypothetical protein
MRRRALLIVQSGKSLAQLLFGIQLPPPPRNISTFAVLNTRSIQWRTKLMQQRCETDADKLGKNNAHNGVGAIQWNYDRAEIIADGVVHALGISLGLH